MRMEASSLAASSNNGAMALHGPHQGAQKSTNTKAEDSSTCCEKLSAVTCITASLVESLMMVSPFWIKIDE